MKLGWITILLASCAVHVETAGETDPAPPAAPPQNGCTVADVCTYPAPECDGTVEPGGCPLLDSPGCCVSPGSVDGDLVCYYSPTYTDAQPCAGSWVEP